jgi:hypothetical protein
MNHRLVLALVPVALLSVGAKGNGCGTEQPIVATDVSPDGNVFANCPPAASFCGPGTVFDTGMGLCVAQKDCTTADAEAPDVATTDASDASKPSDASGAGACWGNAGGVCTPTEELLMQHDPTGACYSCMVNTGCLDDTVYGDTNHECGDLAGTTQQSACLAVASCILGSKCAASAVSTCYCGTAGLATTCQGNPAPGPINGACASQIATGEGFPVNDGTDITKNYTNTSLPSGMAAQLFQCALANACYGCVN